MIRALLRRWRRAVHCRRGEHRELVDAAGGCALRWRCVDCDRTQFIGWIVRVTNKPRPHNPWEHTDA